MQCELEIAAEGRAGLTGRNAFIASVLLPRFGFRYPARRAWVSQPGLLSCLRGVNDPSIKESMMRVFVAGARGAIGKQLCRVWLLRVMRFMG